jgi:hypothetical protein
MNIEGRTGWTRVNAELRTRRNAMSMSTGSAICLILMTSLSVQAQEQKVPAVTTGDTSYKLVWADEFNYSGAPDPNK